jgi:hypothetical protein
MFRIHKGAEEERHISPHLQLANFQVLNMKSFRALAARIYFVQKIIPINVTINKHTAMLLIDEVASQFFEYSD